MQVLKIILSELPYTLFTIQFYRHFIKAANVMLCAQEVVPHFI